jgi:hypothetical protein
MLPNRVELRSYNRNCSHKGETHDCQGGCDLRSKLKFIHSQAVQKMSKTGIAVKQIKASEQKLYELKSLQSVKQ